MVVEVRRLDHVLSHVELPRPILLKVDTQGYESRVIAGATGLLEQIDLILAETSFCPLYEGEAPFTALVDQLARLGYRFLRPVDALRDPRTGEFVQLDALFART